MRLVPEKVVQQRKRSIKSGALHVFPDGFLVSLNRQAGSVEAFDVLTGKPIGAWRLPGALSWKKLSGGGTSLFLLGQNTTSAELHVVRFALPQVLVQWLYRKQGTPSRASHRSEGFLEM